MLPQENESRPGDRVCAYAGRVVIRHTGNQARANSEKRLAFVWRLFTGLRLSVLNVLMIVNDAFCNRRLVCCLQ